MRRRFGVPIVVRYTTTEASLGTGTRPGDPPTVVATTVGRPVTGVELEIADDAGHPSVTGEVGRVRLRSGAVMRGYWAGPTSGPGRSGLHLDDVAGRSVLDDEGWLTTGDFGFVDAEGNLHLAGRANELYIRGGYNVYPAEVEDVLGRHPGIDAAAVLGVPDPVLGEVGVAVVVLAPGAPSDPDRLLAELRDLVAAALADYKAPDRLVVTDALPVTPMMKVDKRALGARLAGESSVTASTEATSGAGGR
jgi:acyl-CoA synthetase (AMP-forming)/AMP-acid ligase II